MWSSLCSPLCLSSLHSQACAEPGVQGCPYPFSGEALLCVGCEFNSRSEPERSSPERFHVCAQCPGPHGDRSSFSVWSPPSVQFSRSVMSDSLQPHEPQHARPPCPSPTSGVYSTHVHRVGDAIQPSHPLSSPSPPAPNPSQRQGLFQ